MKFLLVPIDESAPSFCYYAKPERPAPRPIPLETLREAVAFAQARGLVVNFQYGETEPPASFAPVMQSVSHADIVPLSAADAHPASTVIVGPEDLEKTALPARVRDANIIVRFPIGRIAELPAVLLPLIGTCRRINLCLLDLETAGDAALELYWRSLQDLAHCVAETLRRRRDIELGFLTDRIFLTSMRNCQAGIDHVTVGPEGNLYVCPGFLHDEPNQPVGNLRQGLRVPNAELLDIAHAAICSACDAYHCKRCLYLNKRTTLEINAPSHQQCIASHHERNASSILRDLLGDVTFLARTEPIPRLAYLDPFDALMQAQSKIGARRSQGRGSPQQGGTKGRIEQTLARILAVQEEILAQLKKEDRNGN